MWAKYCICSVRQHTFFVCCDTPKTFVKTTTAKSDAKQIYKCFRLPLPVLGVRCDACLVLGKVSENRKIFASASPLALRCVVCFPETTKGNTNTKCVASVTSTQHVFLLVLCFTAKLKNLHTESVLYFSAVATTFTTF